MSADMVTTTVCCASCHYWVPVSDRLILGTCQRFPPVHDTTFDGSHGAIFPTTEKEWWCGEHREEAGA